MSDEGRKGRGTEARVAQGESVMPIFDLRPTEKDPEPLPDIAVCGNGEDCEWLGPTSECGTEEEGDWESGYYKIDTCPKCGEGITDYDMTDERLAVWEEWHKRHATPTDQGEEQGDE